VPRLAQRSATGDREVDLQMGASSTLTANAKSQAGPSDQRSLSTWAEPVSYRSSLKTNRAAAPRPVANRRSDDGSGVVAVVLRTVATPSGKSSAGTPVSVMKKKSLLPRTPLAKVSVYCCSSTVHVGLRKMLSDGASEQSTGWLLSTKSFGKMIYRLVQLEPVRFTPAKQPSADRPFGSSPATQEEKTTLNGLVEQFVRDSPS